MTCQVDCHWRAFYLPPSPGAPNGPAVEPLLARGLFLRGAWLGLGQSLSG